jgi:hypothetical protein
MPTAPASGFSPACSTTSSPPVRVDEERAVLGETRALTESADDARATFTLHVAKSALEYADDNFMRSLELTQTHERSCPGSRSGLPTR